MDYFEVMIGGFFKGEHLSQYYHRRWKEAEAQFYSKSEFFDSCYKVTELMEQKIDRWLNDKKEGYYHRLDNLRSGNPNCPLDGYNTREEAIEHCLEQLEYYSNKNMVACNMLDLVGLKYGQPNNVWYSDILFFREKLEEAQSMDEPQKGQANNRMVYEQKYSIDKIFLLFTLLKGQGCIPNNTDEASFKYVFGVADRPEGYRKLTWNLRKNLCVYLVSELFSDGCVGDWKATKEFGINNAAQMKTNYEKNGSGKPRGFSKIDEIVSQVKR